MINPLLQTSFLVCLPLLLLLLSLHIKADDLQPAKPPTIARPGCPDRCGNISISFPFGVGTGCFLDSWFEIICNSSNNYKPLLPGLHNLEVMEITIPDYGNNWLQSVTLGLPSSNGCSPDHTKQLGVDLRGTPFNFSTEHNVFVMEGCPGATILTDQTTNKVLAGCRTSCHNKTHTKEFCQMELSSTENFDSPLQLYEIDLYWQSQGKHHNCLAATLIKNESVNEHIGKLSTSNQHPSVVPVLLHWKWVSKAWPDPNPNSDCSRDKTTDCRCNGVSAGNPYVLNGCQLQAACKRCQYCAWEQENSSYRCEFLDDEEDLSVCILMLIALGSLVFFVLFISIGPLLVFGCRWLCRFFKRRTKANRRVKCFRMMLERHQPSNNANNVVDNTKLFTHKELNKATENFNDNRILGKGGQGTVYKGMLTDGRIVAVKKSKEMDESQME